MNSYQYTAKDRSGQSVNGVVDAVSEAEAADILHKKELIVISVTPIKAKSEKSTSSKDQKVKTDDLVIFSRQLATMIDAGIPLVHALGILSEQTEAKGLKDIVAVVRRDIEAGMSFSDALSKHNKVFSELFINMARAGESSGMLDEVLDRLATYLEKSAALNRKIGSSLVYPAVVVTMAVLITGVLLLKVVPTFKGIFESLGGTLPLPTQILIFTSDILRQYFLYLVGAIVVISFIFKRYVSTEAGRYQFDRKKLDIPVMGVLFRKVAVAKFARTFSTLVKSGVSILNALEIVSKTSGNKVIEKAILECQKSVREGEPISKPLSKSGVFQKMGLLRRYVR